MSRNSFQLVFITAGFLHIVFSARLWSRAGLCRLDGNEMEEAVWTRAVPVIVPGWNYSSPQMWERCDKCSPPCISNWLHIVVTKVHSVFPCVPEALLSFLLLHVCYSYGMADSSQCEKCMRFILAPFDPNAKPQPPPRRAVSSADPLSVLSLYCSALHSINQSKQDLAPSPAQPSESYPFCSCYIVFTDLVAL